MNRLLSISLILIVLLFSCATKSVGEEPVVKAEAETKSYVDEDITGKLKFNENSETVKVKVTVKSFIDGDTTHFNVPSSIVENGVLKARFLAILPRKVESIAGLCGGIEFQAFIYVSFTHSSASSALPNMLFAMDLQYPPYLSDVTDIASGFLSQ